VINVKAGRKLKILDFDIENRPLTYLGSDWTTSDITAIAWCWVGQTKVRVALLGIDDKTIMLKAFKADYDRADIVTGHYIREHDLPIIQGELVEFGLEMLGPKMVQDTKIDLLKFKGISKSQENLAGALGVPAAKFHMTNDMWRSANRLEPEGIELTRKRVVDDVKQHMKLRLALLKAGALGPPQLWEG
jgi:hypothetical protein